MALVDMETDSSSFPSSSSAAAARCNYDVFLSFRGEDTRYNFVGHLYEALKQKGIHTFKDDKNLDRGKPISPELLKAIEQSRFAIVIISKDYASSAWCLDELAHIIVCKEDKGMKVLPVFHYVDPSDVRKQSGTFADAFVKLEEKENKKRVEKWREALREVGNLAGYHLKNTRYETEDIKDVMGWISLHLKYDAFRYITRNLVGIYSRMGELESFLAIGSNNVRFIGVWAMGGTGKTTLARVVYDMVSKKFEACSFIEDVRENSEKKRGLVKLQKKLLSNILEETNLKIRDKYDGVLKIKNRLCHRRILLVLDDVNKLDQLENLVAEHDWFGQGSRIIITTRDVHLLKTHRVDEIYEVKGLNDKDALQLFCSKAFREEHVPNDYLVMSKEVLKYAAGLPLALKVLGSFLFGKSTNEWESALKRLKEFPKTEILDVLKISYDGLEIIEKEIFLYIACFFNHEKKDHAVDILDSLGLHPVIGLRELRNKSLLKIDHSDTLWMHDLLEELGKNIVRQECLNDCGKRSRLWRYEDIENVLKNKKGIKVQAMDILRDYDDDDEDEYEVKETCWSPEAISKMDNLEFLRIYGIFRDPQHLPKSLRVFCWRDYPSNSLPPAFQPDELVMLYLPRSKIEQLWIGIKNFDKLKIINLLGSDLSISPDFTGVPNLEKLTLAYCMNLCELHPSVGILKNLVLLNLEHCSNLKTIPEFRGNMKCLQSLNLGSTAIKELPSSIGGLIGLTSLTLKDCKNLVCLPSTICSLNSLECLDLCGCSNFDNLPENLGNLKSLSDLDLRRTAIKELPSSIERLMHLTSLTLFHCHELVSLPNTTCGFKFHGALDLSTCSRFKSLPENPWIIEGLEMLDLSGTIIKELPSSIGHLTTLTSLILKYCKNLVCLPSTICSLNSLECLDLHGCSNFDNLSENLGNLKGLYYLNLSGTAIKEFPSSIVGLTTLNSLTLSNCKNLVCLPSTICSLNSLECLDLCGCSNFDNLPENLGNLKGLKKLHLGQTAIKEFPSSIERLPSLTSLDIYGCKNLVCLPNTTCGFQFHGALYLSTCSRFKNLPENPWIIERLGGLDLSETAIEEFPSSIGGLIGLTSLILRSCKNLVRLSNTICCLKSLACLDLSWSSNFENLPENLGNVKGLKRLNLRGTAIKELPSSIEHLTSLTSLNIRDCKNLVCLPNTTCGFKFHRALNLSICPRFKNLPENPWIIEGLGMLDLSKTAIEEMPSSIGCLTNLTALTLRFCLNLVCLPSTICSLKLLNSLDLYGCIKFNNLPVNIGNMKGLKLLDLCWTDIKEVPSSIALLKNLEHLYISEWKLSEFYFMPVTLATMVLLWSSLPRSPPRSPLLSLSLHYSLSTSPVPMGFLFPSLSGLQSLTNLGLSDCNLLSISDDIGCLSSLVQLDLSGNNFVSLPESMSQLSNLRRLYLEGCKSLQSLESVPSTVDCVIANNCTSLEKLPKLQFNPSRSDHSHLNFQCCNCFKLVDYFQSSNMLQGLPNIIIPGGKIPKWFSLECQGGNIGVSFRGCDDLMGIALCIVLVPNGSQVSQLTYNLFISEFKCFIQYLPLKYGNVESPHLWLLYLSSQYFGSDWGKILSHTDANGLSQLEIKLLANKEGVEKIGVHFIYKQGIVDPNQTMAQCINNNSILSEDLADSEDQPESEIFNFAMEGEDQTSKKLDFIHGGKSHCFQDIEDPNQTITELSINGRTLNENLGDLCHDLYHSAAEGSRNKRSRDEQDWAGPSGEGYSSDEPNPKTWRMYG